MSGFGVLEQRDYDFVAGLQRSPVRFTYIILGLNFLIFALMAFAAGPSNVSLFGFGPRTDALLLEFGAKSNQAIDLGQVWRFLTPVFIHIGLLHLLSNSYALWAVGPQVERLFGGGRYMALYLVTGIAGVAASYKFNPQALSAGASGAIFGLFGALLVFGLRHKDVVPPFFRKAVIRGVLPVIGINLLIGYSVSIVDNSAHIGGLVAGGLMAAILPFQRPGESTSGSSRTFQVVALGAIALAFSQVFLHSSAPSGGGPTTTRDFVNVVNETQQAFEHSIEALASREITRVAASMNETADTLDHLRRAPAIEPTADNLTRDLLKVMEDQYELETEAGRAGLVTFSHEMRARENARRYAEIQRQFRRWVETEGRRRGIELRQKK